MPHRRREHRSCPDALQARACGRPSSPGSRTRSFRQRGFRSRRWLCSGGCARRQPSARACIHGLVGRGYVHGIWLMRTTARALRRTKKTSEWQRDERGGSRSTSVARGVYVGPVMAKKRRAACRLAVGDAMENKPATVEEAGTSIPGQRLGAKLLVTLQRNFLEPTSLHC